MSMLYTYLRSPTASHASIAESPRLGLSGDALELDQCRALLILDLDTPANTVACRFGFPFLSFFVFYLFTHGELVVIIEKFHSLLFHINDYHVQYVSN